MSMQMPSLNLKQVNPKQETTTSKNVYEISFQQRNTTVYTVRLTEGSSQEQVLELLRPLEEKQLLPSNWLNSQVSPEVLAAMQNYPGQPVVIQVPHPLDKSIYQGTGIETVIQSHRKANVALFSLASLETGATPDPDRGVTVILDYVKRNPSQNLNKNRLKSAYPAEIARANTLNDLTTLVNQAGDGRGIILNPNNPVDREWLYTSVDSTNDAYMGKIYKKQPTVEQIRTALHIKEILRAGAIQYIKEKELDKQPALSAALVDRLAGMHPDAADVVANFIVTQVSNPYSHVTGFCEKLTVNAVSSISISRIEARAKTAQQTEAQTTENRDNATESVLSAESASPGTEGEGGASLGSYLIPGGLVGTGALVAALSGGEGSSSDTEVTSPENNPSSQPDGSFTPPNRGGNGRPSPTVAVPEGMTIGGSLSAIALFLGLKVKMHKGR
jgi:hypothetical protein